MNEVVAADRPGARDARVGEQGALDLLGQMFETSWTMICFLRPQKKEVAFAAGSHHIA